MWYGKGKKAISSLWYKATLFCRGPALGLDRVADVRDGPILPSPPGTWAGRESKSQKPLRNGASLYN
jgi:hypothetical protein